MPRIPYADPAEASEGTRAVLGALPPLNVFRMLAHAETALVPYLGFGRAILTELELDPGLRELAILQVARDAEAEYEWVQHEAIGRHAGLSNEQIGAVRAGRLDDPSLDGTQRAVLAFAAEVVAGPRVGEEAFEAVRERLGSREIVELLLTIGSYLMLARVLTVLDLEVDEAIGNAVVDSARSDAPEPGGP